MIEVLDHVGAHENRVFGGPGLGPVAQDAELDRQAVGTGLNICVYPVGVGLEKGSIPRIRQLQ